MSEEEDACPVPVRLWRSLSVTLTLLITFRVGASGAVSRTSWSEFDSSDFRPVRRGATGGGSSPILLLVSPQAPSSGFLIFSSSPFGIQSCSR